MDETDLLDGNGDNAVFGNIFGGNYEANQTPFDVADNGSMTTTGNTTTTTSPSWLSSLGGVLSGAIGIGSQVLPAVTTLTGKTTTPATATAQPKVGAAAPAATSLFGLSKGLLLAIGAGILAVAGFFMFRRK